MEKTANSIIRAFNKYKLPPRIALAVLLGVAENVMSIGKIGTAGHTTGTIRVEIIRKQEGEMPKTEEVPSYIR